ncbi:MAG: DUF5683 domain-containing protein [Prevotellaceae bacterium]|jgi:hypothetical protein|nr:DUF5683 domain-containing protein [Prevotellaceae bacterium]
MITSQMLAGTETGNVEESPVKIKEPRKSYIKGLRGLDSLPVKKVTLASMIVPGYAQAYNRQYWKIPVIYGAGAAMIYGGSHSKSLFKKTGEQRYNSQSKFYYAGAGLVYLGSLIDGIASYKTHQEGIIPAKATLFSTFLPGLGQAYNGDYWKIPVIYAGFAFTGYWLNLNSMQYTRYRNAYNIEFAYSNGDSDVQSEFNGRLSVQSLKSYRDRFRRSRDYAVMWILVCHAVNIADAAVWAQLSNFDVNEDLSFHLAPTIIPQATYAQGNMPAIGLGLTISF